MPPHTPASWIFSTVQFVSGDYKRHLRALACLWPGHVLDVAAAYVPLQQQSEAHSLCLPASTGAGLSHPIRWEEEPRRPVTGRGREGSEWGERRTTSSFHSRDAALPCTWHLTDFNPVWYRQLGESQSTAQPESGYYWTDTAAVFSFLQQRAGFGLRR